ncbi:MAG: hypothetical protein IKW30_06130 [Lachnospiraceae bacterium]|nr:hypothetical protein [Lachnospiraceae bacterium]
MKKLYYEDVHMTEFEATVTECTYDEKKKIYKIVLDQTAFFPEEGGQVADKGTISFVQKLGVTPQCLTLLDAHIKNDIIYHYVEQEIPVGTKVKGCVDWGQRFDFMQQHSGEHIVSGLVNKQYGFDNVGFHLGLQEVTLDFNGVLTLEQLREIEVLANEAIWENIPVNIEFPDSEVLSSLEYRSKLELTENVRIVTIPGYDVCACCAPHVDTTGQIGMIKITNVQSHRGGIRVNILCGRRALQDYTVKQNNAAAISASLSVKQDCIAEGVERLKEENFKQKEVVNRLQANMLKNLAESLPTPEESFHAILFVEPMDDITIRNLINDLVPKYSGYVGVFWGNDTDGYRYIVGSTSRDCRELATFLREKFGAKGGGKAPMIQGNVVAGEEQLRTIIFNS